MLRRALIGLYLVAAVLGYWLGTRKLLPFLDGLYGTTSTPLARVGFALREANPGASDADWARLQPDVDTVRASFLTGSPALFDLVVALRGLRSGGNTDWARAEQSCRALNWRRCDRPALEELKRRSKP
jgi:hypothetical protein